MNEFGGVRVGDRCTVTGWIPAQYGRPASRNAVTVQRMWRQQCQAGVMVKIHPPLHNGSTEISIAWLDQFDRSKA